MSLKGLSLNVVLRVCSELHILETFPGEKLVSRESSRDWWIPIVNKDVAEVDHADEEDSYICPGSHHYVQYEK